MKKFFSLLAAVFVMLISCAGPFMLKTHASPAGYPTTITECYQYYNSEVTLSDVDYHLYFTFDYNYYGNTATYGILFEVPKTNFDNSFYCEYSNNILLLRRKTIDNGMSYNFGISSERSNYFPARSCYAVQLNFNDNTGYIIESDGAYCGKSVSKFSKVHEFIY